MSSGFGRITQITNIDVIPMYLLDWGWETSLNFDILEKDLEVNQTYLVPQSLDFNPLSSWSNQQLFGENDLGKEKVFLQTNRMAEVNGMEFFEEEIDFNKIIVGNIVKVSKLVENIEQALPTLLNTKGFEYHALTPTYHIEVKEIIEFSKILDNPNQFDSQILTKFKEIENRHENNFNFGQLKTEKQSLFKRNALQPYSLESHRIALDSIVIRVSTGEYNTQYYIIKKVILDDKETYFLRFYADYFVDTDTYQLTNYLLSTEEIELLTLNNPICKKFFKDGNIE